MTDKKAFPKKAYLVICNFGFVSNLKVYRVELLAQGSQIPRGAEQPPYRMRRKGLFFETSSSTKGIEEEVFNFSAV